MIGKKSSDNSPVKDVRVADILIDHNYQRPERQVWILSRARKFDADLLNVGEVSLRPDGTYWAIDCQHRVGLCKAVGWEYLTCRIHEGLTSQEEASLFRKFNKERSVVGSLDDWKAAIYEREPDALDITEIIARYEFEVGKQTKKSRTIADINTLRTLYRKGTLVEALDLARASWGFQESVGDGRLLAGVSLFVQNHLHHNKSVTRKKIVDSWKRQTPTRIIGLGIQFKGAGGTQAALESFYNNGRAVSNRIGPLGLVEDSESQAA